MSTSHETPFQQLAAAAEVCGYTFKLRFLEEVDSVVAEPHQVAATFICYKKIERGNGWYLTNKGMRLVVSKFKDGAWQKPREITVWDIDENFVPFEVDTRIGKTPGEFTARRNWENQAYRWGNESRLGQRDSYVRQLDGVK